MSKHGPADHELPYNLAVIVDGAVFRREAPVLLAFRDDDGDWQFLSGGPTNIDDAKILGLGEMLQLDPTLSEILGTPPGNVAIRAAWGDSWRVELTTTYLDRVNRSLN